MQGKIRGFMHLDNGQESIPAFVADTIKTASGLMAAWLACLLACSHTF